MGTAADTWNWSRWPASERGRFIGESGGRRRSGFDARGVLGQDGLGGRRMRWSVSVLTCSSALGADVFARDRADAAMNLLDAVKRDDAAAVRTLLSERSEVNATEVDGTT